MTRMIFLTALSAACLTFHSLKSASATTAGSTGLSYVEPPSGWVYKAFPPDPITDKVDNEILLYSAIGTNSQGNPISLVIGCQDKNLRMIIEWGDFIGTNWAETTVRWIDNKHGVRNKPDTDTVPTLGDGSSTIFDWPEDKNVDAIEKVDGKPLSLVAQLLADYDELVVRVTPFQADTITAVFYLNGFKQAFKPIADNCGYAVPD